MAHLQGFITGRLTEEEANRMTTLVTEVEIKAALWSIEDDKAPGPDGYTTDFSKTAWSIVGEEITQAIEHFFETGKLLKQVNATLLT